MHITPMVKPLSDGGQVLLGNDVWSGRGYPDALCIGIDNAGQEQWRIRIPAQGQRISLRDCLEIAPDQLVLLQYTEGDPAYLGTYHVHSIRNGQIDRSKEWTPKDPAIWPMIFPAPDGYCFFHGDSSKQSMQGRDSFHAAALTYIGADGSERWEYIFNDMEIQLNGSTATRDGDIVFCGNMSQNPYEPDSETHGILLCFDAAGNMLWSTAGDELSLSDYLSVVCLEDGTLIVNGSMQEECAGNALVSYTHTGEILQVNSGSAIQGIDSLYVHEFGMTYIRYEWSDQVNIFVGSMTPGLEVKETAGAVYTCDLRMLNGAWLSQTGDKRCILWVSLAAPQQDAASKVMRIPVLCP
jgi:hypothetical protein